MHGFVRGVVALLALGAVLAAPRLGLAQEGQAGSKIECMTDAQLRTFLADVFFWQLDKLSELCQRKVPELESEVIAARLAFGEKALDVRFNIGQEVQAMLRPYYGDDSLLERVRMLNAAAAPALEYAEGNWTATECANLVENSASIGDELTATSVGATTNGVIDGTFEEERTHMPRCP